MPKLPTHLRLLLLALLTSVALTSCFDHDKKCDPTPRCGTKTPAPAPAPPVGGNN